MDELLASDEPKAGLLAKLDNAKILQQLLKVLQFKDEVVVHATSNGIKVTAEVSRSFFGSAFIQRETFADYALNLPDENRAPNDDAEADDEAEMVFNISLFTLVQCLNVTGSGAGGGSGGSGGVTTLTGSSTTSTFSKNISPSLLLHFPEVGQPLYVWLEENGIVTGATIPTLDLRDAYVDFASMMQQNNTKIVARVILQAEHLCNIFSEFDPKSETLEMSVCPKNRTLTMSTSSSIITNFSVEIPFDSEIVSHFQVDKFVSTKYQFNLLKHALKPMAMAEKVSIRFDSRSFLSIQYMIKVTDTACFMEFYCAPDVVEEGED